MTRSIKKINQERADENNIWNKADVCFNFNVLRHANGWPYAIKVSNGDIIDFELETDLSYFFTDYLPILNNEWGQLISIKNKFHKKLDAM